MRYFSFIAPWLRSRTCPGRDYDMLDIPTEPEKTIRYVGFDYSCRHRVRAFVWLCADSTLSEIRYLTECPCQWQLDRKVQNLTLVSSVQLDPDCIKTSVVYEEPEG